MLEASLTRPPAQPRILTILAPRWRALLAGGRPGREGMGRLALFGLLGAGCWIVIFGMTMRVLQFLGTVEIGDLLARRMLDAPVLGCGSILLLSSLITALSSFFLSRETVMEIMAFADGELDGDDRARIEKLVSVNAEANAMLVSFTTLGESLNDSYEEPADHVSLGIAD
mgnify:CR=1 FL=1